MADLQQMVSSGHYRINVPEEGALFVVAWLLTNDHVDAARGLLDEIGPYLDRLPFYPFPHAQPLADSAHVHLQTIGQTIQNLRLSDNSSP